jgi:hypothetical protein
MIASSDSKQVDLSLKYVCKYRMMCMSPSEAPKTQKKGEEELMVVSSIKSFDNGHEESIHGGIRLSLAPHPCR